MTFKNKLYFFFTIVTISFILDKYLNPCKNLNILANIIHFIHHVGSNYFFYGALIFEEYVFHFILSIISCWLVFLVTLKRLNHSFLKSNRLCSIQFFRS